MKTEQKIAVIGLGNIGKAVAENLNKSGRKFIVAGRDTAKVKEVAKAWQNAQVADIATAVKEADIVIPAIYFPLVGDFLKEHAEALKGKVIVDVSNPIAPDENGGFKKVIAAEAFTTPRKVLFYATDEVSINPVVEQLIKDTGFEPVRVGGLNQSIRLEVFGDLNEAGAVDKPVTLEEARQLVN